MRTRTALVALGLTSVAAAFAVAHANGASGTSGAPVAAATSPASAEQEPAAAPAAEPAKQDRAGALERLLASLAAEGVHLDLSEGHVSIGASVLMRDQLIEHVLCGPGGATHEGLFLTEVTPSLLNAAVLALGTTPGQNATWKLIEDAPKSEPAPGTDAPPSDEQGDEPGGEPSDDPSDETPPADDTPGDGRGPDRPEYKVTPPSGDGLYMHATWREGDEVYFFRIEDLIANLETGRSMPRHKLVYLGSRMAVIPGLPPELSGAAPGEEPREVFVADFDRNLVNLIYFANGNTLFTCVHGTENRQDVWAANIYNLPEMNQPVLLVFSKTPLATCPDSLRARLPEAKRPEPR
jgi:hypothetical protein